MIIKNGKIVSLNREETLLKEKYLAEKAANIKNIYTKAIVYVHIRPDTMEPFYIGSSKDIYRAIVVTTRSKQWEDIVHSTGFIVEILGTKLTREEAYKLEYEYINRYGTLKDGTGTLVNIRTTEEHEHASKNYEPKVTIFNRITKSTANEIKNKLIAGFTIKEVCALYDVSVYTVINIIVKHKVVIYI